MPVFAIISKLKMVHNFKTADFNPLDGRVLAVVYLLVGRTPTTPWGFMVWTILFYPLQNSDHFGITEG